MITLHTNFGDIKIQLNEEKAPETSANFLQYCRDGFYDNTLFHRVIDGFMIQGGGMESGLREKLHVHLSRTKQTTVLATKWVHLLWHVLWSRIQQALSSSST